MYKHGMGDEHHAVLMRNLDEPLRDWLIDHCENCIDARKRFESRTAQAAGAYDFLPDMIDGDD